MLLVKNNVTSEKYYNMCKFLKFLKKQSYYENAQAP